MGGLGGAGAGLLEASRFEEGQHVKDAEAAGAGRRRRDDGAAAIGARERRPLEGPVLFEVFEGDQPAVGLHVRGDELRGFPFIEIAGAPLHETPEGSGQLRLPEDLAGLIVLAVSEEDAAGAGEPAEALPARLESPREPRRHRKALGGQLPGRPDDLVPRFHAILAVGEFEAARCAGYT